MKLHHSEDETGVTFSERDKDIVRAGAEAVDSLVAFAEAAGFTGRGTCEECGASARTRPLWVNTKSGEETKRELCADCQRRLVDADDKGPVEVPDVEEPDRSTVIKREMERADE